MQKKIDDYAFAENREMTEFHIPEGTEYIGMPSTIAGPCTRSICPMEGLRSEMGPSRTASGLPIL